MKRIIRTKECVYEMFLNVRTKDLRVIEYGTWYVAVGSLRLEKDDVRTILNDTDRDVLPILRDVYSRIIDRRNPYFSSKTGRPLSKWYDIARNL